MFTARRFYFRYGNESDPVDCTTKSYASAEKAIKYLRRYQTGLRYIESDIYDDETGRCLYEHTAEHGEYTNLVEG